ncbi:MAG: formate dehydrogenase subunit alpha [Syntrophobacterales bacterium]|nr:formate dehydrogenase subunit alpha [Syntrophobacterales bacterium]
MRDPISSVVCPYCGAGCRFGLVIKDGRARDICYDSDHPVAQGALCPKGNSALDLLYHPDRLLFPYRRDSHGRRHRISWDEALKTISTKLLQIRSDFGPEAVGFLASAKVSNEENYLFQKLARIFGSPNIDHCARLCHAPSIVALSRSFGSGAMTNPIKDLENARCILIIGSNFAENHPVVSRWVWNARDRGAYIISVDPRVTPTTKMAHLHLMIRPGTDGLLLNAMMAQILREGLENRDFIRSRTEGFQELEPILRSVNIEKVSKQIGVPLGDIITAARRYANSSASSIIYCMGVTQHRSGTDFVASCANLALLCGHIGRSGAGVFPLRGQNNVQGASDMGALSEFLPGYVPVGDVERRRSIVSLWNQKDIPVGGLTITEMVDEILSGKIRALFVLGENPLVSDPSGAETERALSRLDLLVLEDIFPTETAELAHFVLPAAMWAEKSGSYTNTERRVQWSPKVLDPQGESKPDLWIIGNLGRWLGIWESIPTPEEVLREINKVVPLYGGITPERLLGRREGLIWPCPEENHPGSPILYVERFNRENGLAKFYPYDADRDATPTEEDTFSLITGRVVVHYNSGSITRRIEALSRYEPKLEVTIHPKDAEKLGIRAGDLVTVRGEREAVDAIAKISSQVREGSLFMPFHFPEANRLTPRDLDPLARIPSFKDAKCKISTKGT